MARTYSKPITVLRTSDDGATWEPVWYLHAYVNTATTSSEYLGSGALQSRIYLDFEVRYAKALEAVRASTQIYQIQYNDVAYNIVAYDDYQERHETIVFRGESV